MVENETHCLSLEGGNEAIKKHGITYSQGYYTGKPQPLS